MAQRAAYFLVLVLLVRRAECRTCDDVKAELMTNASEYRDCTFNTCFNSF
jgi:hypothetical protein